MQNNETTIPIETIEELLKMIDIFNNQAKRALAMGEPENGLMVRQAQHMKKRYMHELNELLQKFDIALAV